MKTINLLLFITVTLTFASCVTGTTHHLASGNFTKNETYEMNKYNGCCGCEAKYFILNSNGKKTEQVIYSYNCSGNGTPTKFIFNYDKKGALVSCSKYIATTVNDYTMKLTEQEKFLLTAAGKSSVLQPNYITIQLSDITGFRKPTDKELVHDFPLIKNGTALKVVP